MENGDNRKQASGNSKEDNLTRSERFLKYLDEKNKRVDAVIIEVEEFLRAYNTHEEVISPRAQTLMATTTEFKKGWLGRQKKVTYQKPFCDALGSAIASYQASKELDYQLRWQQAYDLLALVQKGRVFGVIRNAKQQQQSEEQEILRLKEQIENLKKLNDKLIVENKLLHGIADEKTKGKDATEVGEVGF